MRIIYFGDSLNVSVTVSGCWDWRHTSPLLQEPPLYKDSSHVRLEGSRGVEIVDLRRRWISLDAPPLSRSGEKSTLFLWSIPRRERWDWLFVSLSLSKFLVTVYTLYPIPESLEKGSLTVIVFLRFFLLWIVESKILWLKHVLKYTRKTHTDTHTNTPKLGYYDYFIIILPFRARIDRNKNSANCRDRVVYRMSQL